MEVATSTAFPALAAYQTGIVLLICSLGLMTALTAFVVYRRARQLAARVKRQLKELAEVAAEGLVVCQDGTIVEANTAFLGLLGLPREEAIGRPLASFVAPEHRQSLAERGLAQHDLALTAADGTRVAVSIVGRDIDGATRQVFAVQDLRQHVAAEARIRFLSRHDPLTGLPNRVTLQEELAERLDGAWANDQQFAIFCVDLDRFKEVNDVFGHSVGDAVLVEMTRRIRGAVGEDDFVARLDGDEFTILSNQCDPARAGEFTERLLRLGADGVAVGERKMFVNMSIGIAVFPSHGTTAESLLNNADVALTRAKVEGGGNCCFYNSQMDLMVRERRTLANDLALALEAGDLDLHFQPLAKASTLTVRGFEALVRWRHPERGFVPPSEFVAVAEENGLVHQLGLFVLRRACSEAAKWRNPLDIAVNISPLQFQQGDLPEQILGILVETGLSPSRLELEITETVLIADFDRALSMLRRLKAVGLRVAMDDFGTGWSSLSSLQAFPFDKVKIDRIFIDKIGRHRQADVIVRAILGLCRSLEIPVVAEGVETEEQLEFLRRESCDEMQGYLLARPAPIETFAELVNGEGTSADLIKVA
jgi:diguanylate cyclase (GGDEF)-like protein/PAS domain S-box-containing protein